MAIDPSIGSKFLDGNGLVSVLTKIKELLIGKVDKRDGYNLSQNDFDNASKNKLDSLENYTLPQATKTQLGGVMIDDAISNTSINPVQNKKVYEALNDKVNVSDIVDSLQSTETNKPLSARQGMALKQQIDQINTAVSGAGAGDMLSSVYDTDGDGVVDNAKNLNGHGSDYFAKSSHTHKLVDAEDFEEVSATLATADHTHSMSDMTDWDAFNEGMQNFSNDISDLSSQVKNAQDTLVNKASKTELDNAIDTVTEIANGKCGCNVFDDENSFRAWLQDTTNTNGLKTGHVFLIRAISVPDYWWDATNQEAYVLETTKVNLDVITAEEVISIVNEVWSNI